MAAGTEPSEFDRERLKALDAAELELLKATVAFEHAAIRPLYLLNGGAILATLTFIGNVAKNGGAGLVDSRESETALLLWALGLIAAFAATALGYFSQFAFRVGADQRRNAEVSRLRGDEQERGRLEGLATCFGNQGHSRRNWAYGVGVLSLICFLIGVALAVLSLRLE